mmetsp:Transcript_14078/g.15734  ORF Transcript_14078/g.15734 Transcript_14078/m.15734 type:complete len:150 (+) Transcript_14078:26-475(+)|eukprot:CAMPEP_0205828366 /NCGR_PEP_ID=MMETSP0206-20130828/34932_1 /ASSEMBLY_ACC=CAM_ASM_000279 /TAXON_ID=36767 /ORGANISM="Euplotes focardii, Strain TN1" /LENGTH=149 /DNA_ID=CAMNT_0053130131 /DNA_START=18 /DNA_END=467 /DNA_ORIENTATION=-
MHRFRKKPKKGEEGCDGDEIACDSASSHSSSNEPIVESPFPGYVFACRLQDIPLNGGLKCKVGGKVLGVFKIRNSKGSKLYAISNRCAHQGFPLHRGNVEEVSGDNCVVCPAHGVRFNLRTGTAMDQNKYQQHVYQTKVFEGKVWVQLS